MVRKAMAVFATISSLQVIAEAAEGDGGLLDLSPVFVEHFACAASNDVVLVERIGTSTDSATGPSD